MKHEQESFRLSFEVTRFYLYNPVNNSSWAAQSWSMSGINQSGDSTVHTTVWTHTHTHSISIIENSAVHHFSGCVKLLWFLNTSKSLTISKDWMWHLLCQRQWVQCLALRLHVSKGIFVYLPWKNSDSIFIGKRAIQQPSLKETSPESLKLQRLNKAIGSHLVTQARDFWGWGGGSTLRRNQ